MGKSKAHMPKELEKKCHVAIHSASAAAAAAGAIPIPLSDTIPISAAQIGMIVAIGKVFGVTLSQATAKSIVGVGITQSAGRFIFTNSNAPPQIPTLRRVAADCSDLCGNVPLQIRRSVVRALLYLRYRRILTL